MQNSPQEIKTRLDRAVDPDGNVCVVLAYLLFYTCRKFKFFFLAFVSQVLDMAAVLEIVTTLEQIPVTKEALEVI